MICQRTCPGYRLRLVALTGLTALSIPHMLWGTPCAAPSVLQARVGSHPDADAYTALGIWFGNNHHSECAAEAFQSGLKLQPSSPRLAYLLGLSLYTAGALPKSISPLRRSVELDPQNENAHLLLASALNVTGRENEAFAEWQAVLKMDSNSKMALDGIAKILLAAGDSESVIAQLSGMQLDENLMIDLAGAYKSSGQFDEAVGVLEKGLESNPDSAPLTSLLASVYVKQLRLAEADKVAALLASRNPNDIEAQRVYLQVLVFNAENQTAMPLARTLLVQAPHDADLLYLNGVLERAAGDFAVARKHLEESAALDPNRYSTRFHLGCTLEQLHEDAKAKKELLKAIELDPNEPESRFELAKVLRKLGQTEEAQKQLLVYQKQLNEQSDQSIAAQKSTQAAEASRAGDKQKAAGLYREAIAAQPDNAGLRYKLASVLSDLSDSKGERAALEEAVNLDSNFAMAQYQLGYLDSREGDFAGAEKCLDLAIKSSPGYVQAWVALASTLAMESRPSEALQAVESALKIAPSDSSALELRKNLIARQPKR